VVSGRDAHRLHLLRPVPGNYFAADLHLFRGLRPPDFLSALPRIEQLAGLVARRHAARFYVQPRRRPGDLHQRFEWRRNEEGDLCRGCEYFAGVQPQDGKQIVFVSDRAGDPVLYLANSDGTDVQKLDMPDMGYVVDPSWSPIWQLLHLVGDARAEISISISWISSTASWWS